MDSFDVKELRILTLQDGLPIMQRTVSPDDNSQVTFGAKLFCYNVNLKDNFGEREG